MLSATAAETPLRGVQRGDQRAIDEMVLNHQHGVYSYALSIVRDTRDAEEVAQDTFLRAIRAIESQYSHEQVETLQVRSWLLRITRNLALNRIRARKSRPATESIDERFDVADTASEQTADESGEMDALRHGLARLDASTREWLELRFVQDLSYAEIVAVRGGTEASARGKVFRALATLKELCLEGEHAEM